MRKSLHLLPRTLYPFVWSDYVELHTVTKGSRHFSKEEFSRLVLQEVECACAHPSYTQEDVDTLWDALIEHCQKRKEVFARHYPFAIDEDKQGISLNFVRTHPKQSLYVGMLISANRRHLPTEWHDKITQDFVQVCHQLFINLMPAGTTIQRLPATASQFPAYEQVEYMARAVRGRVLEKNDASFSEGQIELPSLKVDEPKTISGIIDMLGWHPMGDERDGIPVAIARCDCESERWFYSQHTLLNMESQLYTRNPWVRYHFSPIDLYKSNQEWELKRHLGRVILLDRYRILSLSEEYFIYNDVPDWDCIDAVLEYAEKNN